MAKKAIRRSPVRAQKRTTRGARKRNYSKVSKFSTPSRNKDTRKSSPNKKSKSKKRRSSTRKKKSVSPPQRATTRGAKSKSNNRRVQSRERRTKTKSVRRTRSARKQVVSKDIVSKKKSPKNSIIVGSKKKSRSASTKSKWTKLSSESKSSKAKSKKKQTPMLAKFDRIVLTATKDSALRKGSKMPDEMWKKNQPGSSSKKVSRKTSAVKHSKKTPSKKPAVMIQPSSKENSKAAVKRKIPDSRSGKRKRKRQNQTKPGGSLKNVKNRNPKSTRGVAVSKLIDLTQAGEMIDLTKTPEVNVQTQKAPQTRGELTIDTLKESENTEQKVVAPLLDEDSVLASPVELKQPDSSPKVSSLSDICSPICSVTQENVANNCPVNASTPKGYGNIQKVHTTHPRLRRLENHRSSGDTRSTSQEFTVKSRIQQGKATTSGNVGFRPSLSALAGFWRRNGRLKKSSSVSSTASTSDDTVDALRHIRERENRIRRSKAQKRAIHRSGRMLSNKRTLSRSHSGFQKKTRSGSWSNDPKMVVKTGGLLISPLNFKTSSTKRTLSSRRKSGSLRITPSAKSIAKSIGFSPNKRQGPHSLDSDQETQVADEKCGSPSPCLLPTLGSDR